MCSLYGQASLRGPPRHGGCTSASLGPCDRRRSEPCQTPDGPGPKAVTCPHMTSQTGEGRGERSVLRGQDAISLIHWVDSVRPVCRWLAVRHEDHGGCRRGEWGCPALWMEGSEVASLFAASADACVCLLSQRARAFINPVKDRELDLRGRRGLYLVEGECYLSRSPPCCVGSKW
jgi:hypothetical protein